MQLPFTVWFTRAFLPLFGVLIALGLLMAASTATLLETLAAATRWHLFFAGVNTFLASIVWGTWINGRPLPQSAADPET